MLHSISIFLITILVSIGVLSPSPQIEKAEEKFTVHAYIHVGSELTSSKAEEFLSVIQKRLSKSAIEVEFVLYDDPFWGDPTEVATIGFFPAGNQDKIVDNYRVAISAKPEDLRAVSPILVNNFPLHSFISDPFAYDMVYGMMLVATNHCDSAIPILKSLNITDNDLTVHLNYNLATCYLLEGDYQKSIDLYEQHLFTPSDKFLGINLAWLYLQINQEDKAFDLMDRGIESANRLDHYKPALYKARAQLYNLAFRYEDAITDLTTAIELSPADPTLYILRGQTYLLLYEWDATLTDYNEVIERYPTYADAYYFRGVLYYSILQTGQDMYTAALADFQRYLELAPEGEHAAEATRYADDIQTQINALNN